MDIFLIAMNQFMPGYHSLNGLQRRQARHLVFQKLCRSYGYGELSWFCPSCGNDDHGEQNKIKRPVAAQQKID